MNEDFIENEEAFNVFSLSHIIAPSSVKQRNSGLYILRQAIIESSELGLSVIQWLSLTLFSEFESEERKALINLLFNTYPLYADRNSRRSVQGCLQALIANPLYADDVSSFTELIKSEVSKPGLAPSSFFVLSEWVGLLLQHCIGQSETWDRLGPSLILAESQTLESCICSKAKPSLKQSALVGVRRSLRLLFRDDDVGPRAVKDIVSQVSARSYPLGQRGAVILGVVAGVCARMATRRSTLEDVKQQYYSFYIREILGSRSPVPKHIGAAFHDLFSNFTTFQDLKTHISPALEKALLRAPEVVLDDLISPLILSLPSKLDLAEILADNLLKPILSNIKSQSLVIRNGAMSAFEKLAIHSRSENHLAKCADDILEPLASSKLTGADHRALHAKMLSLLPYLSSRSLLICERLALIISKETNEVALGAEITAFLAHFLLLLMANSRELWRSDSSIMTVYLKGLSDKKSNVRQLWAIGIGDMLWQAKFQAKIAEGIAEIFEATLPKLLEIFEELILNPLPAGQTSLAVVAYLVIALTGSMPQNLRSEKVSSMLLKAKVIDKAMTTKPRPSMLLNHRIYTKLSTLEDSVWMLRALEATSSQWAQSGAESASGDACAQAFLFFVASADVSLILRKQALATLSNCYNADPAGVSSTIIHGLWSWVRQIGMGENDTAAAAAKTGTQRLHLAIQAICLARSTSPFINSRNEKTQLQNQLIDMLVLCRPEVLPSTSWIELCLRVGEDPGKLVESHTLRCLEKVETHLTYLDWQTMPTSIELAAYKTAADLAFVAPEYFVPILLERIEEDLSVEDVRSCGSLDVAIAKTAEGVAFVDVLNKKGQNQSIEKNSRDYDTIKWEEEVRASLARKNGQKKMLSSDEKLRVDAQLAKEAAIRKQVKRLALRLRRAIGFINALISGPPVEPSRWLGKTLDSLLKVIAVGAGLVMDQAADLTYISCAELITPRLGSLRRFIGIATLRALGASQLPSRWEQEPLGGKSFLLAPSGYNRLTKL